MNSQYVRDSHLRILSTSKSYWENMLSGKLVKSSFPSDYIPRNNSLKKYDTLDFSFNTSTFSKISKMANGSNQRIYMILLSVATLLVNKYSSNKDVIIGSPILKQREQGNYVNTFLPIRNNIDDDLSFRDIIIRTREILTDAYENQNYPIEKLAADLGLKNTDDNIAFFDIMVILKNIHYEGVLKDSKCNFIFIFDTLDERLKGRVQYNSSMYRRSTVERIVNHFVRLVELLIQDINTNISEIEFLSEDEKKTILVDFNSCEPGFTNKNTFSQVFEEQVEKTPNNTAVVFEEERLTYRELNERANRLARTLRKKGVKPDSIVSLMVERSIEMVVGIVAVLKAGGAYLPIDPGYPKKRIEYILEDSKTNILLTHENINLNVTFEGEIIDLNMEEYYDCDSENLESIATSDSLAYVIYTSGTTGKPKGVLLKNLGTVNLGRAYGRKLNLNENDRVLQFASISFDASVSEIVMALLNGSTLYIPKSEDIKNINLFSDYLVSKGITIVTLPPPYLANVNDDIDHNLRVIITAGSETNKKLVNKWSKKCVYVNAYGPTEDSVGSTMWVYDNEDRDYIPIGQPISNKKVYILDNNLKLQPIGVAGELCIAGDGVAKGYLNRPELTKKKFVDNPYEENSLIYRTGDMARWLSDGNIEFLGRMDDQVKIRGFRVEVGEIESVLLENKDIKDALVLAQKDAHGNKVLCAYIIAENSIAKEDIRVYLSEQLPDFMMPSFFTIMNEFPLNVNGKVDRKALPNPSINVDNTIKYVEPRNDIEKILVDIWKEIFGCKRVGIDDDFFKLGGDSIKTIQVVARLRKYDLKLDVKDFFDFPTIRKISNCVKELKEKIDQNLVTGKVLLTPIQKWFFEENPSERSHFNHSILLKGKHGFDEKIIEKVFRKIVEHHDALRMIYENQNGTVVQLNRDLTEDVLYFNVIDIRDSLDADKRMKEEISLLQSSMDISRGSLVKLILFKSDEGEFLFITVHHLVIDGISWRILLNDFDLGYIQALSNQEIVFEKKTISYKEWANVINEYSSSKELLREAKYWESIDKAKVNLLPRKCKVQTDIMKDGNILHAILDIHNTDNLLKNIDKAYNTEINDVLLTALGITVCKWIGNGNLAINLEGHGREQIVPSVDISKTIGWFTSAYPVVFNIEDYEDISRSLICVKETLRKIPKKGIGYGILKYMSSTNQNISIYSNLIPEINFNYMGQFDNELNTEIFKISRLEFDTAVSPDFKRHCALDIVAIVIDGKLNIMFNYNKHEFNEVTIKELANDYIKNLSNIINHCMCIEKRVITPSDIGDNTLSFQELDTLIGRYGENIQKVYDMSPMQEGMLLHSMLKRKSGAYIPQTVFTIKGDFSYELFIESFNELIKKYEVFRTAFIYENFDTPRQVVLKKRVIDSEYRDISCLSEIEKQNYIQNKIETQRQKGFDLSNDVLLRLAIYKTHHDTYSVIWNFHHIILDGWCTGIILNDVCNFYSVLKRKERILHQRQNDYSSYIAWLKKQDMEEAETYWKEYISDFKDEMSISIFEKENIKGEEQVESLKLLLKEEITKSLVGRAAEKQLTLNTVFQVAWGLVLQKYFNTNDVVFGVVVSGRNSAVKGIEEMVGLFINTIPVRIKTGDNIKVSDVMKNVQFNAVKSEKYSFYPLSRIRSTSNAEKALIDHVITFENYPLDIDEIGDNFKEIGFEVSDIQISEQTNYNFDITIIPNRETEIIFSYNSLVFDKDFIERLSSHFNKVITMLAENFDILISEIEILSEEEKISMLSNYNRTNIDYGKWKDISSECEDSMQAEFTF